jgi:Ca2+-binding EF-hand superfamily protein
MRLKQARATRKVSEKEVDLLFDAMDVQKDGVLFRDDFKGIKIHSNNNSNNNAATTKTLT